ncbi:hypothetical protein CKAN_01957600 [Cinnamomum micranthum f. kanehirae]|uniref:Transmembrane protein n=1 Tax=Cinnamomum micranthum f. kanehirae TaxID=337451 RepID=A0A3S3P0K9_9MAGN|nr:hypothetical protein CKAN_01957600 [Cinnamomum micranthum f. kanehirae]
MGALFAMGEVMTQSQTTTDKTANVVLDIESLVQSSDKTSGSPKMTKVLSRKGSSRIERRNGEDQEIDEASKKIVVKAISQLEALKQPLMTNKPSALVTSIPNGSSLADNGDGRNKRLGRFVAIHPKKILLIFATLSSVGTLILIYFTLAINRTDGA